MSENECERDEKEGNQIVERKIKEKGGEISLQKREVGRLDQ